MSKWSPIKIAYSVIEPSTGLNEKLSPIILLHGMTRTKEDWDNVDQALADATHRKVYKLDARNHGDSEWSDVFDFEILADDVNHFMEQHRIPKALVIGHSMGGRTAMEVAGKYPERIEKVIIEDTPLYIESNDMVHEMRAFFQQKVKCLEMIPPDVDLTEGKRIISDYLLEKIMGIMKDSENSRTRENFHIEIDLGKCEKEGFRWKTNYELITGDDVLIKLMSDKFDKKFNGDIFFICGGKSAYPVMNRKDQITELFPKVIFKEIADATHMVHGEYPDEFVEMAIEFIHS